MTAAKYRDRRAATRELPKLLGYQEPEPPERPRVLQTVDCVSPLGHYFLPAPWETLPTGAPKGLRAYVCIRDGCFRLRWRSVPL